MNIYVIKNNKDEYLLTYSGDTAKLFLSAIKFKSLEQANNILLRINKYKEYKVVRVLTTTKTLV